MQIINLTPHEIVVRTPGSGERRFPPSGTVARCKTEEYEIGEVDGIPIYQTVFGEVEGLPSPRDSVIYIVSGRVLEAVRDERADVFAPATSLAIRDERGQVVAVPGFMR